MAECIRHFLYTPHTMFEDYLNAGMHLAKYELLEGEEGFYGYIEETPGVYANADTLENCRDLLREVLEGWILLGIAKNETMPVLSGYSLVIQNVLSKVA
jgi:predicted RNase H-like HicB family nuclease